MSIPRMHADELSVDLGLVRRLLASQFPEWDGLPIEPLLPWGTDNALYRLGYELIVRLPRIHWAEGGVEKDFRWLPQVAPLLPVEVPVPLGLGRPAEGYPWVWGVYRWIEGELAVAGAADSDLAKDLARFVLALQRLELSGAPQAPRAFPLREFEDSVRPALVQSKGLVDVDAVAAAWEEALDVPEPAAPPVWIHGDLMPANLLLRGGRLAAVLDWSGLGLGNRAPDLMPAWNLFDAETRAIYRAELDVDDETWALGRGWALGTAIVALPYYVETNPTLADNARYRIREILADR